MSRVARTLKEDLSKMLADIDYNSCEPIRKRRTSAMRTYRSPSSSDFYEEDDWFKKDLEASRRRIELTRKLSIVAIIIAFIFCCCTLASVFDGQVADSGVVSTNPTSTVTP